MQDIIKSGFKFLISAAFFRGCINLIYLSIPIYMLIVYDRVLFSASLATLYTLGVGVLICLLAMGVIDYAQKQIMGKAASRLALKMRPFVLNSLPGFPRGLEDLETLRTAVTGGYLLRFLDLPWMVIYLVLLYLIHPIMGGVSAAGVIIATITLLLIKILVKKRYIAADLAFKANQDQLQKAMVHRDLISAMGIYPGVIKKYIHTDDRVMELRVGAEQFQGITDAALKVLYILVPTLVFATGVIVFFSEEITVGAVFACVIILIRLFGPLEKSLEEMRLSIEARAAYDRIKTFVNTDKPKELLSLPAPEGRLEAEGVGLAAAGKTILHNISFSLEPGESLGVFGPSSAGKTSLCKLITGIWPAAAGKIRLDGAEIAQWPKDAFGGYLGYLPQETELFEGSVAENIARLGKVDSDKVIEAAGKAGVHNMIVKLPQGYDTKIDATGKNLSAGQRQLISLARIFYTDPKVAVLDEPHTHLDDLGFRMLAHALGQLKIEKTTTIVVTDRPNILVSMDKIIVLKDGQVAMFGPAKDVLNQLAGNQQQAAGV